MRKSEVGSRNEEEFWTSLLAARVGGVRMVRYGPPHDGGYVVPDLPYAFCMTVGVGNCVGFERDLGRRRRTEFALFDPTIAAPPRLDRSRFHRIGLGDGGDCRPLAHLISSCLPAEDGCNLLKIDCEGGEWGGEIPAADLAPFAVVVIELHGLGHLSRYASYLSVIAHLLRDFAVVNLHGNNYGGSFALGSVDMPRVLEVTLLRKALVQSCQGDSPDLNRPNNPRGTRLRSLLDR